MEDRKTKLIGHLFIIITIIIWGATFVSTKVLVTAGLGAMEIAFYRFLAAYIILFALYPRFEKFSLKDEFYFFISAFFGITLYFLFENTALKYTTASNASLIISVAPLLTALLAHFHTTEKLNRNVFIGFFMAITGIFIIIFNGKFMLKLNPVGDFLAFMAAFAWAVYSILIKNIGKRYNLFYVNRKIFFYGLTTIIPFMFIFRESLHYNLLSDKVILANLLFLGIFASALCYVMWQKSVTLIGIIKTNNYIYFSPVITAIFSVILIHERITPLMLLGAAMIITGVFTGMVTKKTFKTK